MKRDLIDCLSGTEGLSEAALWDDAEALEEKAKGIGVLSTEDEDIRSLRELITYGLKGMAAYLKHAAALERKAENGAGYHADGMRDAEEFLEKALAATLDQNMTVSELTALALETGEYGVKAMAILDEANTSAFGHPEITKVSIGVRKNPGILVSGHDLCDLEQLLEQTEGTGIDVYTHSEMLPAHYYPAFKKYAHFAGNYGNAWWKQKEEFEAFGGPVLLTTNCLVPPKDSYKGRLYTTGAVGYPGCKHIEAGADGTKDFTEMINQAKQCPAPVELETGSIVGGFAHNQVLALADPIVEAVKSGAILTAGCAKYKYNKLNLGEIGGIPRVLDAGQCNDSYSLAVIALKLKEVFGLDDINDLPIIYNIAWYEQKAVIVLLALLSLGVKNIHLGPTLPAFLSPNVANVLVEQFGIAGIRTAEEDMKIFFEI